MESLKELYRIGPGPSSSHTIGVQNACKYYLEKHPNAYAYSITLTGSLALTGKGHMSDDIALSVFEGKNAEVKFDFNYKGKHPNTMLFSCVNAAGLESNTLQIYSVGGGAIEVEGIGPLADPEVYPQKSIREILDFCDWLDCSIADYVYKYEPDVKEYLIAVAKQMHQTVDAGLQKEGILPGSLKIKKIAKEMFQKCLSIDDETVKQKILVSSYAYAAMEENASGGTVVTAPTLGSCGIMSALVNFYYDKGFDYDELADGLAVAGIFGNIVKTNATISGAQGGCQAEVGTACAMGAAFTSFLEGLSNKQIETAAEIAMEHNLGLTCDPVGGYVQVPCIERNGVGVLRSIDAMTYAKYLGGMKDSLVSFDMVVYTMNRTGDRIPIELKETSLDGLAKIVPLD